MIKDFVNMHKYSVSIIFLCLWLLFGIVVHEAVIPRFDWLLTFLREISFCLFLITSLVITFEEKKKRKK